MTVSASVHACTLAHVLFGVVLLAASFAHAQQSRPLGFPDAPGRDVVLSRCFQCHGDAMWRDHRQDRRGWEAVLFRMIGRGALWSETDIDAMAGYLAQIYGKEAGAGAKP
jgi:mono/diheme cytochrome c family protein